MRDVTRVRHRRCQVNAEGCAYAGSGVGSLGVSSVTVKQCDILLPFLFLFSFFHFLQFVYSKQINTLIDEEDRVNQLHGNGVSCFCVLKYLFEHSESIS